MRCVVRGVHCATSNAGGVRSSCRQPTTVGGAMDVDRYPGARADEGSPAPPSPVSGDAAARDGGSPPVVQLAVTHAVMVASVRSSRRRAGPRTPWTSTWLLGLGLPRLLLR